MRTVYKYPLELTDSQILHLPSSAKPLSVQLQGNQLCLWADVPAGQFVVEKEVVITIVGTGHPIPPGAVNYLGTVQQGPFVWHVYASAAMSAP